MKNGSIERIMQIEAMLTDVKLLSKKKSGRPTSAPPEKHISCRLVKPKRTLVFTTVRSFGIVTYAM